MIVVADTSPLIALINLGEIEVLPRLGALESLGHRQSRQTLANILKRNGMDPAPERGRRTTWKQFIRSHLSVMAATDFFTAEA